MCVLGLAWLFLAIIGQEAAQSSASPPQMALALFNAGKYKECFELIQKYVGQNPNDGNAHKILGMDEYMLGNSAGALQEVKRATELSPNDPDAFYYLGRLYFSDDNPKDALSALAKAIELNPSSVRAHNQMGQTYEALGRLQDAEREYREAMALEEKQPKKSEWPYYNLGLLYLNAGHAEQAVTCFRQALLRNPVFPEAQIKLAVALSKQDLRDQAMALLQAAVEEDPQNAEAHYHLALLLSKSGKQQEAQAQFALFQRYRAR